MSRKTLFAVLALALTAARSHAQTAPPGGPPPAPARTEYEQVHVPVPRAITLVADVATALFAHEYAGQSKVDALLARRRKRAEQGAQILTLTVPNNAVTRTLGIVE